MIRTRGVNVHFRGIELTLSHPLLYQQICHADINILPLQSGFIYGPGRISGILCLFSACFLMGVKHGFAQAASPDDVSSKRL
jgi:hypothetical protein